MSQPEIPEPACLIVSMLSSLDDPVSLVRRDLEKEFGEIEQEIGPIEFGYTNYYDKELGAGICRFLLIFHDLIDRNQLWRVKLTTNELENRHMADNCRIFNLDPGILTLGNLVLATGKNNAHRIYLDKGIFADLTLIFRRGSFRPLEWTYPDYSDPYMLEILNNIRENYKCKLVGLNL
ncbi:MAG: DUF4416 family protein [Desulfomonilaceae bacterium]